MDFSQKVDLAFKKQCKIQHTKIFQKVNNFPSNFSRNANAKSTQC